MDTPIVVALVTGVIALGASIISVLQQRSTSARQSRSEADLLLLRTKLEDRRDREARERGEVKELTRYREPLLEAAEDLAQRLSNIRSAHFLVYLRTDDTHRSDMAMLSTLYRLARYWGTVDGLYGSVNLLAFAQDPATKDVAALLARVGKAFATDRSDLGGQDLMVWREEQRAIAELMQRGAPEGRTTIGFASFVDRFDGEFAHWFSDLDRALRSSGVDASPRLALIQAELSELIASLSEGRLRVAGASPEPTA